MNQPQANSITNAHHHLYELVKAKNNFELTAHNWEAVIQALKNLEYWFDFVPKTDVKLTTTE